MNFHGGQFEKENINDFSVNIPIVTFESSYRALLMGTIDSLCKYPEIDGETARHVISKHIGIPPENILLGNGATDLIYLITRSFKFKRAMVLAPTFTEYERALVQADTHVVTYVMQQHASDKTIKFTVDVHELARKIRDEECNCLFICNPNNPTGQLFTTDFIETLLMTSNENLVLVIDESFIEFKERTGYHERMHELVNRYNVVIIRSMTKTYSVPGLRMGYAFGNAKPMKVLNRYRDPWALNRFALESIPYFLERKADLVALQDQTDARREQMYKALFAIEGIQVAEGEANFLLFKLMASCPTTWHQRLIEKGFYLRTCMDFKGLGPEFFRIAIKDEMSNNDLIKAIRESI